MDRHAFGRLGGQRAGRLAPHDAAQLRLFVFQCEEAVAGGIPFEPGYFAGHPDEWQRPFEELSRQRVDLADAPNLWNPIATESACVRRLEEQVVVHETPVISRAA
jgi:hypothetical protein